MSKFGRPVQLRLRPIHLCRIGADFEIRLRAGVFVVSPSQPFDERAAIEKSPSIYEERVEQQTNVCRQASAASFSAISFFISCAPVAIARRICLASMMLWTRSANFKKNSVRFEPPGRENRGRRSHKSRKPSPPKEA
jgi:hypothetical protein